MSASKMLITEAQLFQLMAKSIKSRTSFLEKNVSRATSSAAKRAINLKSEYLNTFSAIVDYAQGNMDTLEKWDFFDEKARNLTASSRSQILKEKLTIFGKRGNYLAKLVIAGDGAVGKTTLRRRFFGEAFDSNYLQTIGADFSTGKLEVDYGDLQQIRLQIWDLAGQPRFHTVRNGYYRGATGAVLVYDITNPRSFVNIVQWITECWTAVGNPIPIMIVGNKQDLDDKRQVQEETGQKVARLLSKVSMKHKGFRITYLPTSAKTGMNVKKVFQLLGFSILEWGDSLRIKNGQKMMKNY